MHENRAQEETQARLLSGADRAAGPPSAVPVREYTFRLADLPRAREFAADSARRHDMGEEFVGDFLIAVNEVATNAVTHGAGKAMIRIWPADGHLVVAVHDDGLWLPEEPPGQIPPPPNATSGMGLWVARLLSARIAFSTGSSGTTVTMAFKV
ncbi:hypothetical protein Misp01_18770 [Microtetraspora sp. NBRC 13810]|uniref:ATP-binding protein n=1 Tax=Microtetraspora sp. NBRC 13810 TaxID=3030990 RepID=UPI0024A2755C|nr:ATP-binding protein [Microtetraspora sp. NBRC 13810]GLW06747.1 hypothetical protein Misp01_18770 [Microtetraspora sp. NBRC 13810]